MSCVCSAVVEGRILDALIAAEQALQRSERAAEKLAMREEKAALLANPNPNPKP